MKNFLPVLLKDFYKVGHPFQYPEHTELVYSNLTPRGSRIGGIENVMGFGFQYAMIEYLDRQFRDNFFMRDREVVLAQYKRRVENALGPGINLKHLGELHELGYLPLHVKAVPEGTLVPLRVPVMTIRNTEKQFGWLTNMLETLLSNVLWMPMTSATIAFRYRQVFEKYGKFTGADRGFIPWQGHDFSMRGMSGLEAACLSGAAHLLSFTGTDTIPAIDFLEEYYGANSDKELVGGSVPATEHSVMCMGGKETEWKTLDRLIFETYPTGIVSVVCDSWDFWKVVTEYLPSRRERILARDGKVVIRPDSGDPVDILCGRRDNPFALTEREKAVNVGLVQYLHGIFGGTKTSEGYLVLNPHIGCIYGDSITLERQERILNLLMATGFASSNVVLGIGSFTYQFNTRDTFGFAMKATYGETKAGGPQVIFKKPATDDGTKNSAKGLLKVDRDPVGRIYLREQVDWNTEQTGLLQTVFLDGNMENFQTLAQIRKVVEGQL